VTEQADRLTGGLGVISPCGVIIAAPETMPHPLRRLTRLRVELPVWDESRDRSRRDYFTGNDWERGVADCRGFGSGDDRQGRGPGSVRSADAPRRDKAHQSGAHAFRGNRKHERPGLSRRCARAAPIPCSPSKKETMTIPVDGFAVGVSAAMPAVLRGCNDGPAATICSSILPALSFSACQPLAGEPGLHPLDLGTSVPGPGFKDSAPRLPAIEWRLASSQLAPLPNPASSTRTSGGSRLLRFEQWIWTGGRYLPPAKVIVLPVTVGTEPPPPPPPDASHVHRAGHTASSSSGSHAPLGRSRPTSPPRDPAASRRRCASGRAAGTPAAPISRSSKGMPLIGSGLRQAAMNTSIPASARNVDATRCDRTARALRNAHARGPARRSVPRLSAR